MRLDRYPDFAVATANVFVDHANLVHSACRNVNIELQNSRFRTTQNVEKVTEIAKENPFFAA